MKAPTRISMYMCMCTLVQHYLHTCNYCGGIHNHGQAKFMCPGSPQLCYYIFKTKFNIVNSCILAVDVTHAPQSQTSFDQIQQCMCNSTTQHFYQHFCVQL